jgi:oligoendopeptidase F
MTLAETASTFAETLIFEGAIASAAPEQRITLLDTHLKDLCQVMVDILSRFYFERELFERRSKAELSPEELCSMMEKAQRATYGDGLDPNLLHPYMWAVKSHYYSAHFAFYNYPYAFGQLFSLSLYARFKEEGIRFVQQYRELLRLTGQASVETIGQFAGFNVESKYFWESSIAYIEQYTNEFQHLIEEEQ